MTPSLPHSSLGLLLDAPNIHPVLACALRGVLATDPGEVACGLGSGGQSLVLPTRPCLFLSLLEGRVVRGAGESMSIEHSSRKPGYSPSQTPPPHILSSPTRFILSLKKKNSLPPWVCCLLPSPCPPPRLPLSHTLVRSRVRRRLVVGKQDQGLSPSPCHY